MTPKELDYVREDIQNEGMFYSFVGKSHYAEIKDEEFHRLRKNFLQAVKEIGEYLNLDESEYS